MKINNASPISKNNFKYSNSKTNVAFQGNNKKLSEIAKNGIKNLFSQSRQGTMSRHLFITNAFVFLLGTRFITSRDKDEKREVVIRDVPSIVLAVQGVPLIALAVSKAIQKKFGFAIMNTNKNPERGDFAHWLNQKLNREEKPLKPRAEKASYSQLNSWYKYEETSSGLNGFSERLDDLGGNLKKIYSSLNKNISKKLESFSDNNKEFLQGLNKNKGLAEEIKTELAKEGNGALRRAEFLKTVPELLGFGITLSLLGIIVPELNIFITEKINKNRKAKEVAQQQKESLNKEV